MAANVGLMLDLMRVMAGGVADNTNKIAFLIAHKIISGPLVAYLAARENLPTQKTFTQAADAAAATAMTQVPELVDRLKAEGKVPRELDVNLTEVTAKVVRVVRKCDRLLSFARMRRAEESCLVVLTAIMSEMVEGLA